jgi:hypothetical protein
MESPHRKQTERGIAELAKASTHQKKNRSRMCLIASSLFASWL